eukprot:4019716-Pleurochrysis_carterae.AAC.1
MEKSGQVRRDSCTSIVSAHERPGTFEEEGLSARTHPKRLCRRLAKGVAREHDLCVGVSARPHRMDSHCLRQRRRDRHGQRRRDRHGQRRRDRHGQRRRKQTRVREGERSAVRRGAVG